MLASLLNLPNELLLGIIAHLSCLPRVHVQSLSSLWRYASVLASANWKGELSPLLTYADGLATDNLHKNICVDLNNVQKLVNLYIA